jgi:hypothetical protein
MFQLFATSYSEYWIGILISSSVAFFISQIATQYLLAATHSPTIIVEIGMCISFVALFMFVTYQTRNNFTKAFEMTVRAEKSSQTVNNIFNSVPDAILLIS